MMFAKPEPRPKTKRHWMNPVSRKQRARNRQLIETKLRLIAQRGPICEARQVYLDWLKRDPFDVVVRGALENCANRPDEMHHIVKRSQQAIDRDDDLMLACLPCHELTKHEVKFCRRIGLIRSAGPVRKWGFAI